MTQTRLTITVDKSLVYKLHSLLQLKTPNKKVTIAKVINIALEKLAKELEV